MTGERISTKDLIAALRRCGTPGESCEGCAFEGTDGLWCGERLANDAADLLEEYMDRCARYANALAALHEQGHSVMLSRGDGDGVS